MSQNVDENEEYEQVEKDNITKEINLNNDYITQNENISNIYTYKDEDTQNQFIKTDENNNKNNTNKYFKADETKTLLVSSLSNDKINSGKKKKNKIQ